MAEPGRCLVSNTHRTNLLITIKPTPPKTKFTSSSLFFYATGGLEELDFNNEYQRVRRTGKWHSLFTVPQILVMMGARHMLKRDTARGGPQLLLGGICELCIRRCVWRRGSNNRFAVRRRSTLFAV